MRISTRIKTRMARPATGTNGTPTNLYLPQDLKASAREVAKQRYGMSLSDLVEELLRREISLKRGLIGKERSA